MHLVTSSSASPPGPALVPAVARAVAVLDRLAQQRQPMSMARLAADLALPKSSVHGLCSTLLSLGYLRRRDDGSLQIGPQVMRLAEAFLADTDVAREFDAMWQDGSRTPDETMLLSVLDGPEVVYLAARNGRRPLGLAFNVGMRLPAHLAATGKAMLAFEPPLQLRRRFGDVALADLTGRGARDLDALAAELALTRQRGYSVDDEGVRLGVYCIAAPVFDAGGRTVAGIGVCLNKAMLDEAEAEHQRRRLLEAARALTRRLGGEAPAALREERPA